MTYSMVVYVILCYVHIHHHCTPDSSVSFSELLLTIYVSVQPLSVASSVVFDDSSRVPGLPLSLRDFSFVILRPDIRESDVKSPSSKSSTLPRFLKGCLQCQHDPSYQLICQLSHWPGHERDMVQK